MKGLQDIDNLDVELQQSNDRTMIIIAFGQGTNKANRASINFESTSVLGRNRGRRCSDDILVVQRWRAQPIMRRCRPLIQFPPVVNSFEGNDRENKHG